MTLEEFKASITQAHPPQSLNKLLQAMWHDANGNWEAAHHLAQSVNSMAGAWIHAYLHRKEGDLSNASYWYHRAEQPVCKKPLPEEWDDIATTLLS